MAIRSESRPHNRILGAVARKELEPLGLIRKGRSRTWLDDHGWWVGVVEFQPSDWSRGSYLNVGATWLWHDEHDLFFDLGHRVQGLENGSWREFIEHESDEQFFEDAYGLAKRAADAVEALRRRLPTVKRAAEEILRDDDGFWSYFDAGVAYGLIGAEDKARTCFEKLAAVQVEYDWEQEVHNRSNQLKGLLEHPDAFRSEIEQAVVRFRTALKLPGDVDIFATCR